MPSLRKTVEEDTLTYEEFELSVVPGEHGAFSDNPEAFLREAIRQAGESEPRAIIMSEQFRSLRAFDDLSPIRVIHIKAPAHMRCFYFPIDTTPEM